MQVSRLQAGFIEGQRMNDDKSDLTPTGADSELQRLDARLKAARERKDGPSAPRPDNGSDASLRAGNRVLADLVGGLAGGLFLGWVIDHFAGTQPWGLLVMMFFGIFVAFRNIVRNSGQGGG
jgi:ATP synthase protein I